VRERIGSGLDDAPGRTAEGLALNPHFGRGGNGPGGGRDSGATTVAYARFAYATFREDAGLAACLPHHGTNGSRGASGNQPTYPPPPAVMDADQPGPPPTNATRAGEYRTCRTLGATGTQHQRDETTTHRP
jgi:hypothetical protein